MEFLRSLQNKKPIVAEARSHEELLLAQLERRADKITESHNTQDHITMDVPLLLRVFELVREGAKSDVEVHNIAERLLKIKDRGILSMSDYSEIAGPILKGEIPDDEIEMGEADDIEHGYPAMPKEDIDINSLRALAGLK
jgi:hypothetical protein